MTNRPSSEEYGAYYEQYIGLVPDGDVSGILTQGLEDTTRLLSGVPEQQGSYRYAAGKWSLKEVLGHITDTERIMSYRLLRIARGDKTPLAGYDQDDFIKGASFDSSTLAELIEDYTFVRRSTLTLLRGLPDEAWSRSGSANQSELTARALAYIIAGHELHHIKVITEKYLA
ncbi:DinB family protein [Paenibacillus eucommiae]|uniref:Damage-inducible protein DinB n=1 Tax=Paenibacillus eucommiae TaxID=1355755 RepID=A0ABS4J8L9_9BACL|nr:DinB family protein [Paenibacillus eucommiae]MBP1995084.1 putative damage-inducible protein DinB [Paenibacillus eucommiae]